MSVDDETGYTTSEDQGDREDAVLSTASTPPGPPAKNRFSAKVSPVSASTLTLTPVSAFGGKVGVDKGVQCSAPKPKLMVSSASQCEGPARISISTGVQCSIPSPGGGQSCSDIGTQASTGVQCSLVAEQDEGSEVQGARCSPTPVGEGSPGNVTDFSKDESEEACDLNSKSDAPGPREQAQPTPAAAPSTVACEGDRGPAPNSKKKRKKPKAAAAAVRPPTAEDAACRPAEVSKTTRGGLGGWRLGLTRRMLVCGIVGFVLAAAWGMTGGPGGVFARDGGAIEGQEDRAQPPVWVTVGGSLTLGDVLASRRPVAEADDAREVQWFRDGRLLPGQIRCVECSTVPLQQQSGAARDGRRGGRYNSSQFQASTIAVC